MDKKQLISEFVKFLKDTRTKSKSGKLPVKTGELAPKAAKVGNVLKVATRMAETLVAMNAVDALATKVHQLIPNTADGLEWLHALPSKIANQTIGRIPVLGAIYRWINNAIAEGYARLSEFLGNETLAAEARKRKRADPDAGFNAPYESDQAKGEDEMAKSDKKINDPKFYGNLDLHKTFTIPGAYTKKTVVNGTLATPKIVAHVLAENPVPDVSALIDRLNQKFTLIKAVRGLSKVDYDVIDIANYERLAKLALLEYYVVKKVIQAAKTYNLVQTNIGDNIISSLGFVPVEVRTNLANYETLLCQFHRFISNNLPMSGMWKDKLDYLVSVNIPDYQDAKVATIHMYSVCMTNVFYDRNNPTNTLTFDCIPSSNNNNYNVMMTNFINIQSAISNNTLWQQLIADYFGAFGAKAMWEDKDYPAYAKPLDIRNGDRDSNREQLKNAFYLNSKIEFITINPGVSNQKITLDVDNAQAVQYPNYQFGQVFDATTSAGEAAVTYTTILARDCYLKASRSFSGLGIDFGPLNYFLLPDKNGIGAKSVQPTDGTLYYLTMDNHETIYSMHKDSYTEEESLDISQFKNRSIGGAILFDSSSDKLAIDMSFKTQEYAVMDSVVYTFGSNGSQIVEQVYVICDEVISDDDLQDNDSAIDFPDEIMCWALIDWMPFTHFTFFGYSSTPATYSPRDMLLIDMDAFGSLDDRAFATAVNYSTYSLQGASLVVTKDSKRVSNLGDVYKDKPSKRG